jgi:hypothetical protein
MADPGKVELEDKPTFKDNLSATSFAPHPIGYKKRHFVHPYRL